MTVRDHLKEKIITGLLASFLLSFIVLFIGPSYLYFTNILEFPFLYSDIWYYFLFISIFVAVVLAALLLPLKFSIYQKVASIIFALGILFWLQGNIMVWNYGLLDGREIIWDKYIINGLIDTAVWLLILTLAFIKSALIYKYIKQISILLIVSQIIVLAFTGFSAPKQPECVSYKVDNSCIVDFSKEKNVIILVLDTYQADVFQEIINEDSSYRKSFDGFTFYRNALGGYPSSYPSIPLLLTGQYYDNSVPIQQYIREAFLSSSIPLSLKQNGFVVHLYPLRLQTIYFSEETASNALRTNQITNLNEVMDMQLRITMFRHVPHFLKKYFYDGTGDLIVTHERVSDLEFLNKMLNESKVKYDAPVFKFYHLAYPHPPLNLNERLEHEELKYNRDGFVAQSKGAAKIAIKFLDELKELGIYDSSMIFIVGDHGVPHGGFGLNLQQVSDLYDVSGNSLVPLDVITGGLPLVLFKPFGAAGELRISDAPVAHADISQTIFQELSIEGEYTGESVLNIEQSDERTRVYYSIWRDSCWNWTDEYLPPLEKYLVTGFSWLPRSWQPSYQRYTASGVEDITPVSLAKTPMKYKFGTDILFAGNGDAGRYLLEGWSRPEREWTWTDGNAATLTIPVESTKNSINLKVVSDPFIRPGKIEKQRVNILVNNQKVGEWVFTEFGTQERNIDIPNNLIDNSMLYITFELPDAVSPLELGVSEDPRKLGIAFRSISLSE